MMKLECLFWNLDKKPLEGLLAELVRDQDVDVLLLVECVIPPDVMLESLKNATGIVYYYIRSRCDAFGIYTRFSRTLIEPVTDIDPSCRLDAWRVRLPLLQDFLLVVTHLRDKLHATSTGQALLAVEYAKAINLVEKGLGFIPGKERTVVVGDMNMNPFDAGIATAPGLNAVMTKSVAMREGRTVDGKEYPFFYNPMWSYFGDLTSGPPGSYYYRSSDPVAFYWNMFDQVLLRPALVDSFQRNDLEIVQRVGETSLLDNNGLPNREVASDHLPILFRLKLREQEIKDA